MLMVNDVDLTPNPQALKFILNERLLNAETRHFANKVEAENDPLAKGVFGIEGVASVFYMDNFVTIEKSKSTSWGQIQRPFINFLKTFDKNSIPVEKEVEPLNNDSGEMLKKITTLINERVRPALASDGGWLEILGMEGNRVKIKYQGACGSCPSAIGVTLDAIEKMLRRDINPAIEVESV
jgi:Fe-S cluster biogenesis protein NfuA